MEILAGIPLITLLVEAVKKAGLSDKFVPLFSLFLGVLYSIGANNFIINFETILMGLTWGGAAIGTYEVTKKPIEKGAEQLKKLKLG